MFYFYFICLLSILTTLFLLVRRFMLHKKNIPVVLFAEALRNENNGHLETALLTYEYALEEVKKGRFHSNLKNKIIAKLKVLHTTINYEKSMFYTRQRNQGIIEFEK